MVSRCPASPLGCSGAGSSGSGWRWLLPIGEHGLLWEASRLKPEKMLLLIATAQCSSCGVFRCISVGISMVVFIDAFPHWMPMDLSGEVV